jgi:Outer membrane protein beta-barrel domain
VLKKFLIFGFLIGPLAAFGQVAPSAQGGNSSVWVGGEVSSFNPDYDARQRLVGIGALVDYNLKPKYGVEFEGRWLKWRGDGDQTQSDYLGGVRYRFFQYQRFGFNAKFLLGGIWIDYPFGAGTGSYFAYAPGAFVDYRLSRRLSVRGDYEYQIIPSAPGFPGFPSHGLSPNGFSAGVTYRILGVR